MKAREIKFLSLLHCNARDNPKKFIDNTKNIKSIINALDVYLDILFLSPLNLVTSLFIDER